MKRALLELLLGLGITAGGAGCSSLDSGKLESKHDPRLPSFEDKVAQVEPGLTNREQIERWFGQPVSVGKRSDGSASWQFRYAQPGTGEALERCKAPPRPGVVKRLGAFIDRVFFYPPRQPSPPRAAASQPESTSSSSASLRTAWSTTFTTGSSRGKPCALFELEPAPAPGPGPARTLLFASRPSSGVAAQGGARTFDTN